MGKAILILMPPGKMSVAEVLQQTLLRDDLDKLLVEVVEKDEMPDLSGLTRSIAIDCLERPIEKRSLASASRRPERPQNSFSPPPLKNKAGGNRTSKRGRNAKGRIR